MSVGTISQLEQATTAAVAAPVEEARTYVHEQDVAHLDETSWRQGGKRAWLWVAVTSWVTVFVVRMSRGGQVARELLGERFAGILVTDRYSAYNWYPVRWRQLCWAHLLRDFEAMRGRGGGSEEIGDALLAQAHQMFTWWHRVREGTLTTLDVSLLHDPASPRGRAVIGSGQSLWCAQDRGDVPRHPEAARGAVDVCAGGRGRTDQ